MRAKTIAIAMLLAVLASMIGVIPAVAQEPDPVDLEPIDLGEQIRSSKYEVVGRPEVAPLARRAGAEWLPGDVALWAGLDNYEGYYYPKNYELKGVGTFAELWLATDISYPDARPDPVVTQDQINYLLSEFDNTMWPIETEFFGAPIARDGLDGDFLGWYGLPADYYAGDRLVILVDNVRDDAYYDSSYPFYIAGFFTTAYPQWFDRNVITIDTHDWANRIGPDVARPYLYEGTFAHELQHLIHRDNDPNEESWVTEGMSMFSEWLCGYVTGEDQYDYFLDHAENSLVVWGDQEGSSTNVSEILSDYGIVYLWTLYLYEHFGGGPFVQDLAQNPTNGTASVDETLADHGYDATFADVFHDFRVACLVDSAASFDLPFFPWGRWPGRGADWVHPYEFKNADVQVNVDTVEAYIEPGAPPWGTDYIKITERGALKKLMFDGADYVGSPAYSGDYQWYSTSGNELWNTLSQQFAIPGGGATLTFMINYDIEEDWDYAYVMVHDLDDDTWTTLSGINTVDDLPFPQDVQVAAWSDPEDFCRPDIDTGECTTDDWNGFTGSSEGYVAETMDLSPFAGHTIELSFVYWTDSFVTFPGTYLDDFAIPEIGFADPVEATLAWVNDGWERTTGVVDADFSVTLVGMYERFGKTRYIVRDMTLNDLTEEGSGFLSGIVRMGGYAVLLVTHDAEAGVQEYAPYEYDIGYPWW